MAQDKVLFQKEVFEIKGEKLPYRILLPKNFDAKKEYPLVLFLHGSGERGNNNEAQLTHGANLFLRNDVREQYPAIVVFPQCSSNGYWAPVDVKMQNGERVFSFFVEEEPATDLVLVEKLLKNLKKTYKIDKNRMYVGGLSMGGIGTFELVKRNPKMFAAAFPICGGAHPHIAPKLTNTEWWVFHGDIDDIVPPKYSEQMVKALQQANAKVKFTLYAGVHHNSWDYAFAEPQLLSWLFSISH